MKLELDGAIELVPSGALCNAGAAYTLSRQDLIHGFRSKLRYFLLSTYIVLLNECPQTKTTIKTARALSKAGRRGESSVHVTSAGERRVSHLSIFHLLPPYCLVPYSPM